MSKNRYQSEQREEIKKANLKFRSPQHQSKKSQIKANILNLGTLKSFMQKKRKEQVR